MSDSQPSRDASREESSQGARGDPAELALVTGQSEVLERIATGAPLEETLDALLRVLEDQAEGMLGSIRLLEDGQRLRHAAAPSLSAEYVAVVDGLRIGPLAGSCGTAAYRGETVVVADIATDPLWSGDRETALRHGLHACWSTPIFDLDRTVLGTFAIYYQRPGRPTRWHRRLVEIGAHTAAIAITAKRAEAERRRLLRSEAAARREAEAAHARVTRVLERMSEGVMALDADARFTYLNASAARLLGGARTGELTGRRIWDELLGARGGPFQLAYERALASQQPEIVEDYVAILDRWFEHRLYPSADGLTVYFSDVTERKRTEQALRESEERLRLTLDAGRVGTLDWDLPSDRITCSPWCAELWGLEGCESGGTGEGLARGIHPQDLPALRAEMKRCVAARQPVVREFRVSGPDGGERWLLGRGELTFDDDGTPLRMIGAVLDVTPFKEAERALLEREGQLRLFVEHSPAAIAMLDREMRYLAASRRWYLDYGIADADIVGRSHYEVFPEISDRWKEVHRRCLAGAVERCEEEPFPRADGRVDWVRWEIRPWRRADGEVGGIVVFSEVITARKRVESDLRASREKLQRAVRAGNVGLWDWNLDTGRAFYSPEWKRQLGHQEDEISDHFEEWRARVHRDDLPRVLAALDRSRSEPGVEFREELRLRHADGSYRQVLTAGSLVADDGRSVHMVGSQVDLTARVELEAQLRHAQRMESVGRLAGGIAHDFNNLLTVITGYAELASANLSEGDPLHKMIGEMARAGERATALTRQLLVFSRRQVSQPAVLDLNQVVRGMQGMLHRLLGEDVELTLEIEEGLGAVEVDPGEIEQVIMNLVVNARDAMPLGGRLTVSTACRVAALGGGEAAVPVVALAVSDTGEGMEDETRERIFEPFFTTKESGRGTGLGLSTVYGIVEQSGGRIEVESAPGRGSTFTIHLPQVEAEAVVAAAPGVRIADEGSETLLLVEDEDAVRELAARILERSGYRVLVAENAGAAVLLLESFPDPVHLLITDVVMPGLSGTALAKRLRASRPEMRVLFVSGYGAEALSIRGQSRAELPLISKPFGVAGLRRRVREVLDARG
ncbi:MAG TPA: PAS domain S-box protein [Thermoanaerobaculia bacterium]|nr:PAS domain S-box protein [Thermoanaerobaculia bacterium]